MDGFDHTFNDIVNATFMTFYVYALLHNIF